jgi:hypothetical protein
VVQDQRFLCRRWWRQIILSHENDQEFKQFWIAWNTVSENAFVTATFHVGLLHSSDVIPGSKEFWHRVEDDGAAMCDVLVLARSDAVTVPNRDHPIQVSLQGKKHNSFSIQDVKANSS